MTTKKLDYAYSIRNNSGLFNLDWNEASEEVSVSYKEISKALHTFHGLNSYPEYFPKSLRVLVKSFYGASDEEVIFCGGSDQGIELVIKAFHRLASATYTMKFSYRHFEIFSSFFEKPVKKYSTENFFTLSNTSGIILYC